MRISIFDIATKKYLFTKVFNIPNNFSEKIMEEIKKCTSENFNENKKRILKIYSPDILTELSFNRFFYFKEEKRIENFNTSSKIKLLKFDEEEIILKKFLKNYIHKEIKNKEKIYEEFPVFATFGYGGFDNLTVIYEDNKLVLKNKEYLNCKVKKAYRIENHFLKISDVIIEDYYYYVPEGAVIFLELPEKYKFLTKKEKKTIKLY